MLAIQCPDHLAATRAFAESVGASDRLQRSLDLLDRFGGDPQATRCRLLHDFAPHSFTFVLERPDGPGTWKTMLVGGLIYSGPGQPLDGSAPALCVGLGTPAGHDWSLHT